MREISLLSTSFEEIDRYRAAIAGWRFPTVAEVRRRLRAGLSMGRVIQNCAIVI